MTILSQKTKSVRKTFTIPNYLVSELEEYASEHNQKQSHIIVKLLDEFLHKKAKNEKIKKRLDALEQLVDIVPEGSLVDIENKKISKMRALDND